MSTTATIGRKAIRSYHTTYKYPHPCGGEVRIDVETERYEPYDNMFRSRISRTHFAPNGERQWDGTLTSSQVMSGRTVYLAHQEACFYVEALFGFDDE